MSLNIKDPEAHKLAQALASETGETMTEAVTVALRERLARLQRERKQEATASDLMAIGRRFAKLLNGAPLDPDSLLYDENGLPK